MHRPNYCKREFDQSVQPTLEVHDIQYIYESYMYAYVVYIVVCSKTFLTGIFFFFIMLMYEMFFLINLAVGTWIFPKVTCNQRTQKIHSSCQIHMKSHSTSLFHINVCRILVYNNIRRTRSNVTSHQ